MKDFLKTALATLTGIAAFSIISFFLFISLIGAFASIGEVRPTVPSSAILTIDMSKIVLSEQTQETDVLTLVQGGDTEINTIGIHDVIKSINTAAVDPSVSLIFMKPDAAMGGSALIEELRSALENFRKSGKAVVSYIECPSNTGMYLASVSDKIYMTPFDGGINKFGGASTQMVFLKDLLDNLGIKVQLIRHGKYKSAGEIFINSAPSKENLLQNKAIVESIWGCWSHTIADSRGLDVARLDAMLNNLELVTPQDFADNGLVDALMTREELINKLASFSGQGNAASANYISLNDYITAYAATDTRLTKAKVAVIYLHGEIVDGNGFEQVAGDRYAKMIADIRKDSSVKAAVLRVNSPGGSVLAAEKILAEIKLLQASMPVVASFGDMAASGGYWVSAGCNKIYSNSTTLTGSIGVFSMVPDFSKTLDDKLHVNIVSVNSNPHADMYGLMRPLTNAEAQYMQKSVEKIYDRFTGLVAEGRNMKRDYVDEIAQGRVWTGEDALAIGLVDEIGTIEDAISWAVNSVSLYVDEDDISLEAYPKPLSKWEMLLTQFSGSEPNILAGTPFKSVGDAFSSWTKAQAGKVYARVPYEFVIR